MRLVLASASERRQELLKRITEDFDIIVSDFDESAVKFNGDIPQYVMTIAKGKACEAAESCDEKSIIIGCDTIVSFSNKILGKPRNEEEAALMLELLSGNTHEVYSGIAIMNKKTKKLLLDYVRTEVKFSFLEKEQIQKYINSKEPMDKAGAYGIQGLGGIFVESINGCYYNVVGLPLNKLHTMLKEMGVNL